MVCIPLESVAYRKGAVPRPDMVSVLVDAAAKENAKPPDPTGDTTGLELETTLSLQAWVRNVDPVKYSWVDLHVFDENDRLIRAETVALEWATTAGDDGDIYAFDGSVYRGTGAVGGSVWFGSDARKLQYRLYYEVNGTVFSDGLLRQHDVLPDSEVVNPGSHASRARTTTSAPKAETATPATPKAPATAKAPAPKVSNGKAPARSATKSPAKASKAP